MDSRVVKRACFMIATALIALASPTTAFGQHSDWRAPASADGWSIPSTPHRIPRESALQRFAIEQGRARSPRVALRQTLATIDSDDLLGGDDLLDDGLLGTDSGQASSDDPLADLGSKESIRTVSPDEKDPHEDLWTEDCYPSAETCRQCHPVQYEQWRASGHAYASVSPMFNRFEQSMTEYTRGTVGSFCVRCHSPIQTQLKLPRSTSPLDAPAVVREGVTCIACHRVNEHYWRSNGDRRIEPGNIHAPVYGSAGGTGVRAAIAQADKLKLKLSPHDTRPGQPIHTEGRFFQPLTNSDVCVSCHQVAVHPGIWLEVVHAQYRSGPAAKKGITCQQCHMGAVPGKPLGYDQDYVAYVADRPFGEKRKQSNHMFWGPGFSIAHPGIFPHNPKAKKFTPREWLAFDYRAGWGTEEFEKSVPPGLSFPPPWDTGDDRRDGRKIIDQNLVKLDVKRAAAIQTMEGGLSISKPYFGSTPRAGKKLRVSYRVDNTSEGHNLPTGSLGAQPQLWLNVVLIDPDGCRVWESGYLDRHGDLADMHSVDVATGRVRRDTDLFNLQTKFLINNIRGTDREAALPLNFSLDQLVFLRPGAVPVSVLNHPPLIRMEAHSIPPLDHRIAKYTIPASALSKPGPYRLSVRMRSRTEPMYFMRQIKSTPDMIQRMLDNTLDLHPSSHTFWVR
ncbi:MAG: multiheme c-type cytochrome [Planctomycetota bacterium]